MNILNVNVCNISLIDPYGDIILSIFYTIIFEYFNIQWYFVNMWFLYYTISSYRWPPSYYFLSVVAAF